MLSMRPVSFVQSHLLGMCFLLEKTTVSGMFSTHELPCGLSKS